MVRFVTGNIFDSKADALVNTVNTQGVMGKGIALQFKQKFPHNFNAYAQACKSNGIGVGKLLFVQDSSLFGGPVWVINFPTKITWRKPSEYTYIEQGLDDLVRQLPNYPIRSLAMPPLGSGNGGLHWPKVRQIIEGKLQGLALDVAVYEPNSKVKALMNQELAQLTDARALLLYVLYDLVSHGELVSEFASEKVCYFLQRFGAHRYFKLQFKPYFYGPYSGKVRHVLNYLSGSYMMDYSGLDKKPFEPIMLAANARKNVEGYVNNRPELESIAVATTRFLSGFYSDFSLELLSTIDYLMVTKQIDGVEKVKHALAQWSDRKRTLFNDDRYIDIALKRLHTAQFAQA